MTITIAPGYGRLLTSSTFIDEETAKRFASRYVRRLVRYEDYAIPEICDSVPLETLIEWELSDVGRRSGFGAVVVEVQADDGMSWSATVAERTVERHSDFPFRVVALRGARSPGSPTELERLGISRSEIAKAAERRGVIAGRWWLRKPALPLLALLFVLATVGIAMMKALGGRAPSSGPWTDVLISSQVLLPAAISALLGLAVTPLKTLLTTRDEALRRLFDELEGARLARPTDYNNFISDLGALLANTCAGACVIVDRYAQLDLLARGAIRSLLSAHAGHAGSRQVWVIFEREDEADLRLMLAEAGGLFHAPDSAFATGKQVRQLYLTAAQREQLAGRPEWADRRPVREVVHGPRTIATGTVERFLNGYRREPGEGPATNEALELVHLLAASRLTRGRVEFSSGWIERQLAGHTSETGRWAVLRQLLRHSSLTKAALRRTARQTREHFQPLLEGDDAADTEIGVSTATLLSANFEDYGLPHIDLAHLFWAMYWHDAEGPHPSPFWLRKTADHACAALPPAEAGLDDDITDRLFWTCIETARAAVHLSLFDRVIDLLETAEGLLDGDVARDRRARALRALAWETYALIGDESVLSIPLRLQTSQATQPIDDEAAGHHPLDLLFAESLTTHGEDRSDDAWRTQMLDEAPVLGDAAIAYGRVRSLWLALTVQDEIVGEGLISAAVERAGDLPDLVDGAIARLDQSLAEARKRRTSAIDDDDGRRPAAPRVVVDMATISIGAWCLGLAVVRRLLPGDTAIDLLARGYWISEEVRETASGGGAIHDLAVEGLAGEVVLMTGAAAAIVGAVVEDLREPEVVEELKEYACGGRVDDVAARLEHRMGLQQFLWRRLGFQRMSHHMGLRRAQFIRLTAQDPYRRAEEVRVAAAQERDQPGYVGLLARWLSAAAVRATSEHEAMSELMRGVELAILPSYLADDRRQAMIGERLARELSLTVVAIGNQFGVMSNRLFDFLLTDDDVDASRMGRVLSEFADDNLTGPFIWIGNLSRHVDDELISERLLKLLERRASRADPSVAREALGSLSLLKIGRRLISGKDVDAAALVRDWPWRDLPEKYVVLLGNLMQHRPGTEVIEAALALLDELPDSSRSERVGLAYEVASSLSWLLGGRPDEAPSGSTEALRVAIDTLSRDHPETARGFKIGLNLSITGLLMEHDPENVAHHRSRYAYWSAIEQTQAVAGLMPMAGAERWFEIVWHYYRTLAYWGMPTEPRTSPNAVVAMPFDARLLAVEPWTGAGRPPEAQSARNGNTVISASFLVAGHSVCFVPEFSDKRYDQTRTRVHLRASEVLQQILSPDDSLLKVPPEIREILDHHRRVLAVPEVVRV